MEPDNYSPLLVESNSKENNINLVNNLDTDNLSILKQKFPEFEELNAKLKKTFDPKNFINFPVEKYNDHVNVDLSSLKPLVIGGDKNINNVNICRKCGLLFFIFIIITSAILIKSAVSIIIILIAYILLQINQYFNKPMQNCLKFNKNKEEKIKDLFTSRVKTMHEISIKSKEEMNSKFKIKNSIDITGYVDLTKPPMFYFQKAERSRGIRYWQEQYDKVKNNNPNINNHVSVHFGYEIYYVIENETEKFLADYIKNASKGFVLTSHKDIYTFEFLRKFDTTTILSIIFLVFDYYYEYGKKDKYSIIPRKIISLKQDLGTEEIFEKTKQFRPKLININNEVIEFKNEDIYHKIDEKECEELINEYEEKFGKEIKLYESLGIKEGVVLFEKEFEYIKVKAEIGPEYCVNISVIFLINKYQDISFVFVGNISQSHDFIIGKVDLNCKKECIENIDGTNYIYIKYMPDPFQVKLLGDYKALLKYQDHPGIIFGPTSYYSNRGPIY